MTAVTAISMTVEPLGGSFLTRAKRPVARIHVWILKGDGVGTAACITVSSRLAVRSRESSNRRNIESNGDYADTDTVLE